MSRPPAKPAAYRLPNGHWLRSVQRIALPVAIAAGSLSAFGARTSAEQFYRSYLTAYVFWLGLALGSMGILMLQYITGGVWGAVIRRVLEAATRTLPLLGVLFLPLLLGMQDLYVWARPDAVAHDSILQQKSFYLNVPFFLWRAGFYFAVWLVCARFLNAWSITIDGGFDRRAERRLQFLARGGILLYALTMTFASIDWMMSIQPHWFSHIYGMLVIGGQVVTGFAFAIAILAAIAGRSPIDQVVGADQFHDLGKLLLAFIMLWAYFALSQFLIIWSGNLPEEAVWYAGRSVGGWQWVGIGLVVFHFALPFVILLSRPIKQDPAMLAAVAVLLLAARFLDVVWLVHPSFTPGILTVHWLDAATLMAIGGVWIATFVRQLGARPLLPIGDPILPGFEEER